MQVGIVDKNIVDLTWSCKGFEIVTLWDVFKVQCFNRE